jgi:phenylacetate-CoA ligase
MENRFTHILYERSPWVLKCLFASLCGMQKNRRRFRGAYARWAELFREAHLWSEAELWDLQCERLQAQVRQAYAHVSYYRDLFDRLRLRPDDIRTPDDLKKLPILEKTDVIREGVRLISDRFDLARMIWHPTSGSTGTPLDIPWQPEIEQMEWAFVWTRYRPETTRRDPYASFAGLELVPPGRRKPPFWIDNWAAHQRMFSVFHLSDDNLPHYVDALRTRYHKYYTGYASAVYVIADFMRRRGLKLARPPEYFFAASEELQPQHEAVIAEVFGCQVYARYGQGELVGSITKYPCGHLHYDMDFSIIEFLPVGEEDGGVLAEVIGTNMHDVAWPLLRYRTGDLVVYDPNDRCEAGVPGRIIRRIHGRTGQYFTLPDGSRVSNISVIAKKCRRVRFMQVVQEKAGEIIVRIVPDTGYTKADEEEVVRQFRRKLGDDLVIHPVYEEAVERTRGGKYLSIVNRVVQNMAAGKGP